MSNQQIQQNVFSQSPESIDNKGLLNQYVLQADGGYYIGLENGSSKALNLKLILEGLVEENHPNESVVKFNIGSRTRKVFFVKVKEGHSGGISFLFGNA